MLVFRRAIWPFREMLSGLMREEMPFVTRETRIHLRDAYDHVVQLIDLVETYREMAASLMDVYLSSMSQRLNEVMKVLTIISTIFIPLTFIAGVYGMNFRWDRSPWNMPELGWRWGYLFALLLMAAVALVMVFYFRRHGWIGPPRKDLLSPLEEPQGVHSPPAGRAANGSHAAPPGG
jgi:magnesium transporter